MGSGGREGAGFNRADLDAAVPGPLDRDIEDLLETISLVAPDPALQARQFDLLVDVLVRSAFARVRSGYEHGSTSRQAYVMESAELAKQCRRVGLLHLPLGSADDG